MLGSQAQKEVEIPLSLFALVCFHAETGKEELASILVDVMGERAQEQTHWGGFTISINWHNVADASQRPQEL